MTTAEVLKRVAIPRSKLYYLEQKGYIRPRRRPMGELEAREYSEQDVQMIEVIWKYLKQGFRYRVAYSKACEQLTAQQKEEAEAAERASIKEVSNVV